MNYILGYGSLILKESRNHTGKSGEAIPVEVGGYRREWNQRGEKDTFLGIVTSPEDRCNGLLVQVPEDELCFYDEREREYSRCEISIDDIERLDGKSLPEGKFWVYLPDKDVSTIRPNEEFPIAQSYLDVVLTGCLQISRDFAERFIDLTSKWGPILCERNAPIYSRALKENKFKDEIDELTGRIKND